MKIKFNKITSLVLASFIALTTGSLFFVGSLGIITTGCTTPGGGSGPVNQQVIDATALIIRQASQAGAMAAVQSDTNNAIYFATAADALGQFVTGTNYSPSALQADLMSLNVPQLNNQWVQLGIGSVVDLYQLYYQQYVVNAVNGNQIAQAFIQAIQQGFNQALGRQYKPAKGLKALPSYTGPILPRPIRHK
jgi:hypothetical protein